MIKRKIFHRKKNIKKFYILFSVLFLITLISIGIYSLYFKDDSFLISFNEDSWILRFLDFFSILIFLDIFLFNFIYIYIYIKLLKKNNHY